MENDELKGFLKIDFPDYKVDNEKIISSCKQSEKKKSVNNSIVLKFVLSLLCVVLMMMAVLFINYTDISSVAKVNEAIENLDCINDSNLKMQEIMKIDKEIKTLSIKQQEKVNMYKLSYELKNTTTNLKSAASWSDVINNEVTYFAFNEIIDTYEIKELFIKKDLVSNITIRLSNDEFIDSLLETVYLPYIDIIDNEENFYENYKVQLSGDNNDFFSFQINDYDDANEQIFNIYVYGSGYVLIIENINNELAKAYISLIPLDYLEFKLTYGAYSITSDFYFYEVVSFDSIKSISITESTYWALLGVSGTFLNDDQMLDYYNRKLKVLKIIENDELVKSIQSELGSTLDNDTCSITIALNSNDSIAIFVSKTTHRFIIIHGIMTYAGVDTFEYE